jgi:hypothetical protein
VPVATFAAAAGEPLTLVRVAQPLPEDGLRAANLEEVVMGYLASARVASAEAAA